MYVIKAPDDSMGAKYFYGYVGGVIHSWGPSPRFADQYPTKTAARKVLRDLRPSYPRGTLTMQEYVRGVTR